MDLLKLFGAFLVCAIHVQPFPDSIKYSRYLNFVLQNCFCRIAVPFYLIAAGYFLYRKIEISSVDWDRIKRYEAKLVKMFGIWSILLFVGGTVHLWFIGGLIMITWLVSCLISKKVGLKHIFTGSIILYIIGLLGDSYFGIVEKLSDLTGLKIFSSIFRFPNSNFTKIFRLGLFSAPVFFVMGIMIAQGKNRIKPFISALGWIISVIVLFGESYLVKHYGHALDHNMYLSLIPETFFLFSFAIGVRIRQRPIYKKMRSIGILIFYSHMFVSFIISKVFEAIGSHLSVDLSGLLFISTLLVSFAIAVLLEKLSHLQRLNFLKHLYS